MKKMMKMKMMKMMNRVMFQMLPKKEAERRAGHREHNHNSQKRKCEQ